MVKVQLMWDSNNFVTFEDATNQNISLNIYDAGAPRQPKWGHLKDLHKAIKLCEEPILARDPTTISLGNNLEVRIRGTPLNLFLNEPYIYKGDFPTYIYKSDGPSLADVGLQTANMNFFVLQAGVYETSSGCAAFLANVDTKSDATVNFKGNSYHLPAWSVSILPDCKNVVFNTAKVYLTFYGQSQHLSNPSIVWVSLPINPQQDT